VGKLAHEFEPKRERPNFREGKNMKAVNLITLFMMLAPLAQAAELPPCSDEPMRKVEKGNFVKIYNPKVELVDEVYGILANTSGQPFESAGDCKFFGYSKTIAATACKPKENQLALIWPHSGEIAGLKDRFEDETGRFTFHAVHTLICQQ
jgi:hypothetical protein